jgi:hypothetical protein
MLCLSFGATVPSLDGAPCFSYSDNQSRNNNALFSLLSIENSNPLPLSKLCLLLSFVCSLLGSLDCIRVAQAGDAARALSQTRVLPEFARSINQHL